MTRPMPERDEPVGRRVARWRVRRRMTQQMLADRLGKSKSWVDKVERGVRNLDRYSVVQEIAEVLRLDPTVLLDPRRPPPTAAPALDGIDAVRAALAHYHQRRPRVVSADEVERHVAHAWLSYQHAHYAQLLRALPALLDATDGTLGLLVSVYRITASVLVKLGEPDLAWLAADRAVAAATGDAIRTGTATIAVAQALRALGRDRLALTASVAAVGTAAHDGVRGTLLLQAAMAAAGCGDGRRADDLIDHATALAERCTGTDDPHHTAFGPATVRLARFVSALHLGDSAQAVYRHEKAIRGDDWHRLPAEHRAAHLMDAARAYLHNGDVAAAGRALADADTVAPAEVRYRPAARTLIAEIARSGRATASVARLATLVGLTR
ncbi:transcriptional regulator with XRE-family HTH domain [Micromonospora vinacea]|uniref:Transcriptional regulator with XRE-family HTH domain n=1 Tax=Micromonospora vinacea TaxID=709878 RepID=A0ABS0K7C2_9ACTN|nr:helix-turn-helix transcriptional regulator [Micromonospora vinacea]MBG6104525.1 transcriptional regulator with XRE-family HTH domain [Micromonospora vinacea]